MKKIAFPRAFSMPESMNKVLWCMKLSFILVLAACLQVSAKGYSQNDVKLSLHLTDVKLAKALTVIEKKSDHRILFSDDILPAGTRVRLEANDMPLADILNQVLANTGLHYRMLDNNVIIIAPANAVMAAITIKGRITDNKGAPLIGVTVKVEGSNIGTVTDQNGNYEIDAPSPTGYLVFSFIGYVSQRMAIGGQTQVNVVLQESATGLNEVIVVGYGTQKKINLSGAVESVSGKELANRPITNVNDGLEGLIANLNISPSDGRSTTAPDFNVRGFTSINGGSALILVDNVPATKEEVARLNPADIESVTVLKDAAAAAIYGARAGFGVVLITTKTATSNKLAFSADANYAVRTVGSVPDIVTDPLLVMQMKHAAATPLYNLYPDAVRVYAQKRSKDLSLPAVIVDPTNPNAWAYYGNTNWMKQAYQNTAPAFTGNLSIAKKDNKLSYYLSGEYYRQDGLLRYGNDILNRYNLRAKATYQVTNWLKFGTNTAYTYEQYSSPNFIDGLFFWDVNRTPSLSVPKNPDGTWTSDGAAILGTLQQGGRRTNNTNDILASFNGEISLVKDIWDIKGDATFRRTNITSAKYNLPVPYRTGPGQPIGYRFADGTNSSYALNESDLANQNVFNIYTDFHRTFHGKHYLQALAGFNQEYRYWNNFWVQRTGLITNSLPTPQLATGTITQNATIADWAVRGIFYRLNYIYNEKYIVELDGREDGSSHYPSNDRWGFFPSASAAWVISNEHFFKPVTEVLNISLFKLRGSYGSLGNQITNTNPQLNNYPYIPTMSSGTIGQILDGSMPIAVYQPGVVSTTITWEKVKTVNGGVDLSLLGDKLAITYDRYTRYTEGMLAQSKTLPAVFGATEPHTNSANLKTRGWELSIGYRDQVNADNSPIHYSLRFILADSRSFITQYDNPNGLLPNYNRDNPRPTAPYYQGEEIGSIWGLVSDGYFQNANDLKNSPDQSAVGTDDQQYKFYVGDLKFKDLNGDGKINYGNNTLSNPGDQKIIGNNSPRFPYSLDLSGDWKGFDLRIFFQGIGKRDWYPGGSNIYFWGVFSQPWTNPTVQNLNHWTPDNPNAYFPRLKAYSAEDGNELSSPQTRYLQNAAYLRLKNITVGYSLPQSLMKKWKLSQIRFYFSAENILTVKHLAVNMDPEGLLNGFGGYIYPFQRTYSFGMNLNF